jgi:SAM-dependent methyltransferase
VQKKVYERLRALNHEFYQTFAEQFADKRTRLQPGVKKALRDVPPGDKILDLGCGHGMLAEHLISSGHEGEYLGVDGSDGMIALARQAVSHPRVQWIHTDFSHHGWIKALESVSGAFQPPFSTVYAFASLHHIPGEARRQALVGEVAGLMRHGGCWIISVWDFLQSDRLRQRILPWESIGMDSAQVEPGDYLIDWRHGGQGIRYVHHYTPETLGQLALTGGFERVDTYRMDGEKGKLGLYQVWKKP